MGLDRLVARLGAAGLEVDHDDVAVGVELEPVGVAGQLDLLAVVEVDHGREPRLGAEQLPRVGEVPVQEPAERRPDPLVLAGLGPRACGTRAGPRPRRRAPSGRRRVGPSTSPVATRWASACSSSPRLADWWARATPPASRSRNHWVGQTSSDSSTLAETGTGWSGSRTGCTDRLAARVPHHVDGSALGTSGAVADRLARQPGQPAGGGRRAAARLVSGSASGAAQLADQAGHRQRPRRPADDLLDGDAELVEEPRRLLAVVLGRRDRGDDQPLRGRGCTRRRRAGAPPSAARAPTPAARGRPRRSGRPGAASSGGAGRASRPAGRGRRRPAATRGPWRGARSAGVRRRRGRPARRACRRGSAAATSVARNARTPTWSRCSSARAATSKSAQTESRSRCARRAAPPPRSTERRSRAGQPVRDHSVQSSSSADAPPSSSSRASSEQLRRAPGRGPTSGPSSPSRQPGSTTARADQLARGARRPLLGLALLLLAGAQLPGQAAYVAGVEPAERAEQQRLGAGGVEVVDVVEVVVVEVDHRPQRVDAAAAPPGRGPAAPRRWRPRPGRRRRRGRGAAAGSTCGRSGPGRPCRPRRCRPRGGRGAAGRRGARPRRARCRRCGRRPGPRRASPAAACGVEERLARPRAGSSRAAPSRCGEPLGRDQHAAGRSGGWCAARPRRPARRRRAGTRSGSRGCRAPRRRGTP